MVAHEMEQNRRVVATTDHFVAICPFASRMPYEMWILPRAHASHFECQADQQLDELAHFLRGAVARLESVRQPPTYNFFLHTAPFDTSPLRHYHWHIEIFPRLTTTAGFEWGTGYYINPVPPEQAAAILRT
jgi:UDPglucose--hexose-1-phosphate uridylyltransferase